MDMVNAILHVLLMLGGIACAAVGLLACFVCTITGQWLLLLWAVIELNASVWLSDRMRQHLVEFAIGRRDRRTLRRCPDGTIESRCAA
jgi:hypothetical protein